MTKKRAVCFIFITVVLSVFFTSRYCEFADMPTSETFKGTYQFNDSLYAKTDNVGAVVYLSISCGSDDFGAFTIYDSTDEILQSGECKVKGDYLSLSAKDFKGVVIYAQKNYYFITDDMMPDILEKKADNPIE